MKLKLLFGALVFTAISANAQVATINETFESFTTGLGAPWPQNNWSKVVSTAGPRVYADGTTDKYAQFYSFFYPGVDGYLVSPQIVAPDGTKTLTFTYAQTGGTGSSGTLQVGLISESSTTGTAAFTSISPVYNVTSTTEQTVTITVPSSTKQYIAFKFIGSAEHAAVLVDDVIYDTPPAGTINENFNAFTGPGNPASLPQNGWNKVIATVPHNVYTAANNGSNAVQFYANTTPNTNMYLISPKIVAPDGSKKIRFTTNISSNSLGNATIEVGMVSSITDMTTFTSLGSPIALTAGSTTPQILTFDVPTSTKQYIAWRFSGATNHAAAYVDDVIYDVLGSLATSDITKSTDAIKFAVNSENTALQFVGKDSPKSVEIYSALGTRVAAGTVDYNRFNISTLQTGVYYILIETKDGKIQKSKFIKK
ncbi:choice-of-anchor J domain-containing protein [Chryseobacterium sp. Leaf394]|uniref:T9SS-dependent choice-of-anchor J family protein n=1 Tax=Chryseobacterium sp. Leaf394 TaxID=1736361 RepID=UPI0006F5273E|nr:choice-of-anchor J domain-containing protein [Chryseobacterium sp. Leaf394]KQS91998.1 hypothetical protein ASG21_05950 [Chryseobacterium sp. Leaf394]